MVSSGAATWTIRGVGTVLVEGAEIGAGGGALLVAGATGVVLQQPVPISREQAEHIGSIERAERAKFVADAHGRPVALPTPSPFVDEKFVQTLPTQAEIERHQGAVPHPMAGTAPHVPDGIAMESRRYPFVDSNHLAAGVKALGDTGRCFPDFHSFSGDSRSATQQLSKLMQPPPGWETHHLVEQSRTAQFGTQAIQNTANAINLPEEVHRAVSAAYSSAPRLGDPAYDYKIAHPEANITTTRDFVKTLPFEEQRQFSINQIRDAMGRLHTPERERSVIEQEIRKLENPTLCPPDVAQVRNPTIGDVQNGVDRLRADGVNLPNVQSVQSWNGKAGYGSFVEVADGIVAQHTGRGNYQTFDVARDLGGVQPPIGQIASLGPNGIVLPVQQMATPALGLS